VHSHWISNSITVLRISGFPTRAENHAVSQKEVSLRHQHEHAYS